MELRQQQVIESYQRVQRFLDAHPNAAGSYGGSYAGSYGEPKARLDAVVERLTAHATRQMESGRKGRAETSRQRALKRALREDHLRPIAKIAHAVLHDAPGIAVALRLPRPQLTVTRLLADASAVRNAVAAYQPVFVENALPADFMEELDAAIAALRVSLVDRAESVGARVGARHAIAQEIRRGRAVVEILDVVVTKRFGRDDEVMASWRSAKRVHASPTSGSGSGSAAVGGASPRAA